MLQVSGISSGPFRPRSQPSERESGAVRLSEAGPLTHLMTRHLADARPRTDAEALRVLRQAFPAASLAERVAAMAAGRAR